MVSMRVLVFAELSMVFVTVPSVRTHSSETCLGDLLLLAGTFPPDAATCPAAVSHTASFHHICNNLPSCCGHLCSCCVAYSIHPSHWQQLSLLMQPLVQLLCRIQHPPITFATTFPPDAATCPAAVSRTASILHICTSTPSAVKAAERMTPTNSAISNWVNPCKRHFLKQ